MYSQRSATALCRSTAINYSLYQLLIVSLVVIFLSTYSRHVHAEQGFAKSAAMNNATTPFYRQLQRSDKSNKPSSNSGFLQQVAASNITFDTSPIDRELDDDLAFNYLWMQQYQQGYRQKAGGAAVGKLLRMSVKSIYNAYTGSTSTPGNKEDFTTSYSELDYRLRLSGDKVKFGVKYEF